MLHAVLARWRFNRLNHVDVGTSEPIRRYEHDLPGAMIYVGGKKIGRSRTVVPIPVQGPTARQ